jgi:hypothetical protein
MDTALEVFINVFVPMVDKYAPVKKVSVRTLSALWIDDE